ncbi:MAG: FAD-dependent monooxygenase [Chloroflexota bacterium]|nr:MAG: FAD-dependent monooxygenase [Chloroflexota bacterium]
MQEIDLLIIGSGPAGISTALHLLQQDAGWSERMILLEKAAHPRPKLCAGGVTRIGLEALRDLGMNLPLPIPNVEIEEARLVYQDRVIRVRGEPEFVVYNRIELDAYLSDFARQQGINIRENESVQTISLNPGGFEVETSQNTYRAKAIVGADGSKGITRRLVDKHETPSRVARVIETVNPAKDNQPQFTQGYAIFDLTPSQESLQGYYWEFPSRVDNIPSLNRGVYDSRIAPKREKANLPGILKELTITGQAESTTAGLQGHPLHWFSPSNRFSIPRLLLVGDAAGADPLFGEGIGPALAYGKIAALELHNAYRKSDYSFKYYRLRLLVSNVGRYLGSRWLVAWFSYHLNWSRVFMHGLWSFGKIMFALWPKPGPLYSMNPSKVGSAGDQTGDSVK